MYQYSNSLIRQFPSLVTGNASVGIQATVYVGETNTKASLFEVNGTTPKSNPVTTDGKGFYSFSVADGDYRIVFSSSQFATLRISVLDGAKIREEFDDLVASNLAFRNEQQAAYDAFVLSQGWDQVGTFAAGFTFTSPNQVGQDVDGNWWRWNGALPKTVTAGTLPSSDVNYKLVGDGVLRSDLAAGTADVGGINSGSISYPVSDISELLTAPKIAGRSYAVTSYHSGWSALNKSPTGGGRFVWQALRPKSQHNGGTVIAPEAAFPADWSNETQKASWFSFTTTGNGCFVRIDTDKINVMDFGAKGEYNSGTLTGANDAKSWQKAIDVATELGIEATSAGLKESFIAEGIFITCAFDGSNTVLYCKGSVIGSGNYAVYIQANKTVGTGSLLGNTRIITPQIRNVDKPIAGWAGQSHGLTMNNCDSCHIDVKRGIVGFVFGFYVTSYTGAAGTAYNDIYLGRIVLCQYGLLLQPNGTGYVNENNFYSGKIGDTVADRSLAYLTILPPTGQGFGGPNANKFYGLTVEDGGAGTLANHIVLGGSLNMFIGTRFEFIGAVGKILVWREDGNDPTGNLFIGGYSYGEYTVTATTGAPSSTNKFKDVGRAADIDGRFQPIYGAVVPGGIIPYQRLYSSGRNLHNAAPSDTDWLYQLTNGGGVQTKNDAAANAQVQIAGDRIYAGTGAADINAAPFIKERNGGIGTEGFDLVAGTGAWNSGHLRLGANHLWVDATGDLRIKSSAPTSDTDGVVVGAQS